MLEQAKIPLAQQADSRTGRAAWKAMPRRAGVLCLILATVTLAVYLPVGWQGFVNYDDSDYVTENAHVQSGLNWANVTWAFTTGHASNWHPLTWVSHMLDCQFFGLRAGGHHLVSVDFHIANTLLLFLLLRRMTGAMRRSALVAALFALHPLHVESVAWASERKDVLSAFFFMLTLWAYVRYVEGRALKSETRGPKTEGNPKAEIREPKPEADPGSRIMDRALPSTLRAAEKPDHRGQKTEDKPEDSGRRARIASSRFEVQGSRFKVRWYWIALGMFALGLMSKPMLVTLPFVLLLLDYWPLKRNVEGRMRSADSGEMVGGLAGARGWAWLVAEKVPFVLLAAASSIVTFIVQRKGGAVSTSLPVSGRVANALVSYVRYIGKMFWPADLSVLYPHPIHWPAWQVMVCSGLLLAVCVAVFLARRTRPYLAVGWLWFCGTLVPVIGLVQVGIQSMADRYTYVPLIGLFIMLVWGVGELVPARPWRASALAIGAAMLLAACAGMTERQIRFWRNSEALFGHAVLVTRDNYLAYNNLGFYLSGQGRVTEAMANYRMALKINPAYEDALNNLGYALAGQKQYAEAIPLYDAALRIKQNHAEVHNNLGNALSEMGKIDDAIEHYLIVLRQKPDHADAHNNLGIALAMQGKLEEAIPHFHEAIRCKPGYASAHSNLGNALAAQHKLGEATKEYREALRLKPEDPQAHNNLGNALAEQGDAGGAIEQYQEALRLNADNPEAQYNLALALIGQGKRAEAVPHIKEALRLRPGYPEAQAQLKLLLAQPQQ